MVSKYFAEAVKNIPDVLHAEADEMVECLLQQHIADAPLADENQLNSLKYVLACSHFIQKQSKCHDDVVLKALERGIEQCEFSVESLHLELAPLLVEDINEGTVMVQLRRLRNREMMLIAWRDLMGASIENVLCSLSELADELIRFAVNWSYQTCCKRWGVPRDDLGEEQKLIVIGMGKLGAKELNFSSDIDLIFCYPSAGETDGSRSISNEEFFMRQCRQVVKLLDQQTVDGFVFRVDARLRPFGDSGALALNFDAMENYYQSHAREWERYAMVKARAITGIEEDKNYLMSMLRSFVFRRYLDYGVFDSIRVMKRQIEEQLKKKGVAHNVKLGPGGIREIEFIGQAFQLIRGGRDKPLQVRSIVEVLRLLAEKNHIPAQASEDLIEDYAYLRRLENRIQEIDDKQTHDLPKDEVSQARLVLSMQLNDWDSLLNRTQQTMQRVHKYFDTLVDFVPATPDAEVLDWLSLDSAVLEQFLNSKGVIASDQVQRDIIDFCNSYPVRQLQEKGRHYLSQLMPVLINAFLIEQSHEVTLSAFLSMLQAICNRVVYLVLLVENTSVLKHLIQLAILSPWVITQVTRSPILLDELIDPESLFNTATKEQLADELNSSLISVSADDVEGQMEALRHFKQVNVLRVAASDLTGVIPVMIVSDKLTEIAEVIVDKALALSWRSVCETYGVPVGTKKDAVSGFAVIGFGKMGGIELGFGSDLDVVFIHKDADMNQLTVGGRSVSLAEFYMRLGRKMIAMMTTKTFSGPLYEMDLRLRPNGQSGLLVTSEVAFETYQKEQAWTWEHQALVRARYVAGCEQMKLSFERIRRDVLSKSKDANTLKEDIIQMREKMRDALLKHKEGCFDLKHGVGGIVDIEFIVQFAVLANACRYESLLMVTDNVRLLLDLCRIGVLTQAQQEGLTEAYKAYREASHHASLAELPTVLEAKSFEQHIKKVESVWREVILN